MLASLQVDKASARFSIEIGRSADPTTKAGLNLKFIFLDDDQIVYHSPLFPEDIAAVEGLLRGYDCFVPSFVGADPYSVETYIAQYARE